MSRPRTVVPIRPGCSDGDPLHVPKDGAPYTKVDPPTQYLEKIADSWMEDRREATANIKYILDQLPAGYTLWERARKSDPAHIDRYLFGHPSGQRFDSPNRFWTHFKQLMESNGSNIGCQCKSCSGGSGLLPRSTSSSTKASASSATSSRPNIAKGARPSTTPAIPQHPTAPAMRAAAPTTSFGSTAPSAQFKGRPKLLNAGADMRRVDEEGTPDVYRNLIDKLKRHHTVDEMIEETLSPDWLAEQEMLPKLLQSLQQNEQWVPRTGEIVLFIRDLADNVDIMRHEETGEIQLYDENAETLLGFPPWEAGLVAENPQKPSTIASLHRNDSTMSVIYSGIRVEPVPDPNGHDKSISKRHKYVTLRQARPFILWRELLHSVPQELWHPTVVNALTVMATHSLVGRHRFRGLWPEASVRCHGMYLGSEMVAVGDTIRLLPSSFKNQTQCQDILVIKSIRLKLSGLDKASNNDYDDGRPYNSSVWIYGTGYTSDPLQMNKQYLSEDNTEPPKAAADYGEWYPIHPSTKELAVPFGRVLGRLYEREAMAFWLNSEPGDQPTIDNGRQALLEARAFSRQHYHRIAKDPAATWFWGDSRADSLSLRTINGVDVSKYDAERDIRDMRKNLKVVKGMENGKPASGKTTALPTLGSRNLRQFMAPGTADQSPLPQEPSSSGSVTASSSTSANSAGKKRPHIINLSDDEDEIRESTRVVEEGTSTAKKSRVAVVIK